MVCLFWMSRITSLHIETTRRGGLAAAALVFLLSGLAPPLLRAEEVPEPSDYRMDDYRTPTPKTLEGAKVVTAQQAYKLWHEGKTIFIDVMPRPIKPADLPMDTLWFDKPRETVPGAVWLPNIGYGKLAAQMDEYVRRNLEALTGGNKDKPLLFFCMANCWMSWNAARRALLEYGYTDVTWFPQGTDGWHFPDAPLTKAEPKPLK
jgi:PQQ-dependent catabolism-associated CXXCW motif protein